MYCQGCQERIYESNFDGSNPTDDTSAICETCLDYGKHLRCMNSFERELWEKENVWYCTDCFADNYQQSDAEADVSESSEEEEKINIVRTTRRGQGLALARAQVRE